MAVLLITHELDQAEALCDRLLVLAGGRTLAFDRPTTLLSSVYQDAREVMVRFAKPPQGATLEALKPFNFTEAELPTIWTTMTNASQVSFVSAFMASLRGGDTLVREISVRRPGLNHLMHVIEKTGELPVPVEKVA
jgi:ABC-2 type transport system ATP-binding protein